MGFHSVIPDRWARTEPTRRTLYVLWLIFCVALVVAIGSEFSDKEPLVAGNGISVPFPRFMAAALIGATLLALALLKGEVRAGMPCVMRPLLVFWGISHLSLAGMLWMGPTTASVAQFAKTSLHFSAYVVFTYTILKLANWPRVRFLLTAYYGLGIVAALLSLTQYANGTFGWFAWVEPYLLASGQYRNVAFRAASLFGEASWAARYYVHWIALSLAFYSHSRRKRHVVALILFGIAFYAAASLAGYLYLGAFATVLLLSEARRWLAPLPAWARASAIGLAALLIASALIIGFGVATCLPQTMLARHPIIERVGQVLQGRGGFDVRLDSIQAALRVWSESPVFGAGLGNTRFYIAGFYNDPNTFLRSTFCSDSTYSQLLSDTGVLGLAAFLLFLIGMLRGPSRHADASDELQPQPDHAERAVLHFLRLDLLAYGVAMLNYADYFSPQMWIFFACVLAVQRIVLCTDGKQVVSSIDGLARRPKQESRL